MAYEIYNASEKARNGQNSYGLERLEIGQSIVVPNDKPNRRTGMGSYVSRWNVRNKPKQCKTTYHRDTNIIEIYRIK